MEKCYIKVLEVFKNFCFDLVDFLSEINYFDEERWLVFGYFGKVFRFDCLWCGFILG